MNYYLFSAAPWTTKNLFLSICYFLIFSLFMVKCMHSMESFS